MSYVNYVVKKEIRGRREKGEGKLEIRGGKSENGDWRMERHKGKGLRLRCSKIRIFKVFHRI
jgi:hypothetical protein